MNYDPQAAPDDTAVLSMTPAPHFSGEESLRPRLLGESSSLELTLRALRPLLANPEVTELCINRPGEAFLETRDGWQRETIPFADYAWCLRLAKLVANATKQRI